MIVAVLTLLILVTGATYAYFTAQGGNTSQTNLNVTTHTTDSLVFEVGAPISIYADQSNFADGMANQFGKTTATAIAKAGSNTEKFIGKYNIFFVIDENDFEYTTTSNTAELIMTVKEPNGTELTSIPNLTHTTVKGVSGFDITTKKGTYAVAKEYVIEAATGATKIDNWEITVTLVNLDSNQNANTKKTFRGQLFVTKENMESYALPIVNTIETTVGGSGTELEVKAKIGASTAEVVNYYYAIEEASTATPKVKRLATTSSITYEKSTSDTHTFTGLTSGKNYKVSIYTEDANGFKSPTYENVVTTDNYVLPKITSVEASVGATNIDLTVNTTQGNNAISKYFYKVEGIDTEYQESTSNKKSYTGLTTGETYTVYIYTQDTNGRNSCVYSIKIVPVDYHNTCNDSSLACAIAKKYTDGSNEIYYHNETLENGARDNSYRYSGAYETTNNWICFGYDDPTRQYTPNWCDWEHLYRIIGAFDSVIVNEQERQAPSKKEYRIKLIKAYEGTENSLGTAPNLATMSSKGLNTSYKRWHLSEPPGYYWSGSSDNTQNIWTSSTLNTTILNGTYLTKLGMQWSNKIANTEWVVGGNTGGNIYYLNPSLAYQNEILNPAPGSYGQDIYTTNAKVGLMYVSDYGFATTTDNWSKKLSNDYASDNNRNNNWLYIGAYEWTISRISSNTDRAFVISYLGNVSYYNVSYKSNYNAAFVVRPSFYLNSDVTLTGGTGTESDPYRIA